MLWKLNIYWSKKIYDFIEKSNYFKKLELNNDYIWQGEITNIFIGFYLFEDWLNFKFEWQFAFEKI